MTNQPCHSKRVMPVVWAIHEAKRRRYSDSEFRILVMLADHMDGNTLDCWPSVALLAAECDCSERHVQRILRRFETDGLITITQGTGRGFTSRYRLLASTVNGVSQPDLFGEPAKPEKVPSKPRKGDRGVTHSEAERVTGESPIGRKKGDNGRTKRVTRESPGIPQEESPKKKERDFVPATAVAVPQNSPPEFDPRKVLWSKGVESLRSLTGQTTSAAKRQIGQFLKLANQDAVAVLRAVEVAEYERPFEPVPWITAAIQARASKRQTPLDEIRERWNLTSFITPGGAA